MSKVALSGSCRCSTLGDFTAVSVNLMSYLEFGSNVIFVRIRHNNQFGFAFGSSEFVLDFNCVDPGIVRLSVSANMQGGKICLTLMTFNENERKHRKSGFRCSVRHFRADYF